MPQACTTTTAINGNIFLFFFNCFFCFYCNFYHTNARRIQPSSQCCLRLYIHFLYYVILFLKSKISHSKRVLLLNSRVDVLDRNRYVKIICCSYQLTCKQQTVLGDHVFAFGLCSGLDSGRLLDSGHFYYLLLQTILAVDVIYLTLLCTSQ